MNIHKNPASTDAIRAAVRRSPLTQSEIARRTGTTDTSLSRYVTGLRKPSPSVLARLASVLDVPVRDLMDPDQADD